MFDNPRPALEEIVSFYSQLGQYDGWLANEVARDDLWKRRLRKMLKHNTQGSLLDVGTGIGQFLHHAKASFSKVQGTEVSETAVSLAKEKYGLVVFQGELEHMDLPAESYDNISLFHVLEHVPNPAAMIQKCRSLLSENGTLFIAVPNEILAWTSTLKRLLSKSGLSAFKRFSPKLGIPKIGSGNEIHLSHFAPEVLRRLLAKHQFNIIVESTDPYFVATGMKGIAHLTYYHFHAALMSVLKRNYYDTIWMVARKAK